MADKNIFLQEIRSSLSERWRMGSEKYQSEVKGFQGSPLQHAIEESLDLPLYLFYTKRYLEQLEDLLRWVAGGLEYPAPDRQAIITRIEDTLGGP